MPFTPTLFVIALASDYCQYTIEQGDDLVVGNVYRLAFRLPAGVTVPDIEYTTAMLHIVTPGGKVFSVGSFTPSVDDPQGTIETTLDLTDPWFVARFLEAPEESAREFHVTLSTNYGTLLSSDFTFTRSATAESSGSLGLTGVIKAIRFDTEAHFSAWLSGQYVRADGITPADLFYGQFVHTQCEGTYVLTTPIDQSPSLGKNFTKIKTPFPVDGWLKVLAGHGLGGFAVYTTNFLDDTNVTMYGRHGMTHVLNGTPTAYEYGTTNDNGVVRFRDLHAAIRDVEVTAGNTDAVVSRVQALEAQVAALGGATAVTPGTGITVNGGVVSLTKDLAGALSEVNPITSTDSLSRIIEVLNILINASK